MVLPANPVTQWSEEIGSDEVGDGGGEEGGPQLPLGRVHRVHHVNWQRRLQHSDSHVRKCDGPCSTEHGKRAVKPSDYTSGATPS